MAGSLYRQVAPRGSLIKGHYTDWVANPADYPASGMGGANVGPEFTKAEFDALLDLSAQEEDLLKRHPGWEASGFMETLEEAVIASGRWMKWLQEGEIGLEFHEIDNDRRLWLLQTGARYMWSDPKVQQARSRLYSNLKSITPDPHRIVVESVLLSIEKYIEAFHLRDSLPLFEQAIKGQR